MFHLSAGLAYDANKIKADASAPAGATFSLHDVSYQSSGTDPVSGNAKVDFNRVAPMALLGWGNLARREGHVSYSFEVGAIFQGTPRSHIGLHGRACPADAGADCSAQSFDVARNTDFQSNLLAEQGKLDDDLSAFKFYPIVSIGLGYRF